jgi:PBP1b-binding outer membrane lipoprotein LpoB
MQKTGALEFPIYTSTVVLQNCSATATKERASKAKAKQRKDLTFKDFLVTKLQLSNPSGSNNQFFLIKKNTPILKIHSYQHVT